MGETKRTRRGFLKAVGATVGVLALAGTGVGVLGTRPPASVPFPETACDKEGAVTRVLVTYASKTGTTAEIAEAIGKVFCEHGLEADVRNIKGVKDLEGYDAVVLGSAIRMGKPYGTATRFVKKHLEELAPLRVAVFGVGAALKEDTPENREQMAGFVAPLKAGLDPVSTGLFGGAIIPERLGFLFRKMAQASAEGEALAPGDWRDWDAINAWALELADYLA